MHIHQLQDLTFSDHIGRIGKHLEHPQALARHHHLESARIEEVADQHAGRIAEHRIGGRLAAAQRGFIDDIVMQQGRRMDEFDHRCELEAIVASETEGVGKQQHQLRTHAFAAGMDDVSRDLVDHGDIGRQASRDDGINLKHLGGQLGENLGETIRMGRDGCGVHSQLSCWRRRIIGRTRATFVLWLPGLCWFDCARLILVSRARLQGSVSFWMRN